MEKLSCVIPAFNEAESLPHLWAKLLPVLERLNSWEVIFVSDGSTDGTVAWIRALAGRDGRVKLVDLRRNQGKSAALTAGFKAVTGDRIVTLDADLQDDPEEIPNLLRTMDERDVDLVGGWKKDRHDPVIKKISSKIFNGVANAIMKTKFHDLNCGLKAYRTEVVRTLNLYGDFYRFIPILAMAQGWRAAEITVHHRPREYGVSKYGLRLNGLFDLVSLLIIVKYRWRPLHFFGRWGVMLAVIGIAILVYLTILRFMGASIGNRPLLTFGVLFVIAGLQLLFTGLLADLIINQRPRQ